MQSYLIIINGKGGVGKDTLIDGLSSDKYNVANESSIDPIKDLYAPIIGGYEKTNEVRKLLSEGKALVDNFNIAKSGYSYTGSWLTACLNLHVSYLSEDKVNVMFAHIREPERIVEFIEMAKKELMLLGNKDTVIKTMLIRAPKREQADYDNTSDNNVEKYKYDYYYTMTEDKNTEQTLFEQFFDEIVVNHNYNLGKNDFSDYEEQYKIYGKNSSYDINVGTSSDGKTLMAYETKIKNNKVELPDYISCGDGKIIFTIEKKEKQNFENTLNKQLEALSVKAKERE